MKSIRNKLLRFIFVVLAVTALTFLMMNILPGDVAYTIGGAEASLEDIQAIRKDLGLDRNIVVRYFVWLGHVVQGDFGKSYITHEPVLEAIINRLPVTVELMFLTQFLALLFAIPIGIFSAYKPHSVSDKVLSSTAFATMSVPVFVMALLLIYLFALKLRWLPATGYIPLSEGLWPNIRSFILPAMSIAMVEWVSLMRVLRNDMIATLQEDYILMARSKGLPASHILIRHALRPSLFTLITILGMQIGHLIGGALIAEIIFALPGIGRLLVGAIYGRDFILVQGCILFITVAYVSVNALVDFCYVILDPRIRRERSVG
ncbi:ABC transporter permease [Desulfococcaceae bacterium HSG7]|nr:ABC transporter permease [Desulfococcaceae bacterium HSG7]